MLGNKFDMLITLQRRKALDGDEQEEQCNKSPHGMLDGKCGTSSSASCCGKFSICAQQSTVQDPLLVRVSVGGVASGKT